MEYKKSGKPNPNPKGPFKTLGFPLTDRDIPGQIKTAPDAVMLKAFRDTLDDIQDIEVGQGQNKEIIPAKSIKAHMLLSIITGMRNEDINNFVTVLDPTEEQYKEMGYDKTFLRTEDRVMVINNKGKPTAYPLNPPLYSVLLDAVKSSNKQKVFPSTKKIQDTYLNLLTENLTKAGFPNPKQDVMGVLKPIPLTHKVLRKYAFSLINRLGLSENLEVQKGGGTSIADALIQHVEGKTQGEQAYQAGQLSVFQESKETTGQRTFFQNLLPTGTTPAQFLEQQGFNPANFVSELYSPESEADMQALGSRMKTTVTDLAAYQSYLESLDVSPETQTKIQSIAPSREAFDRLMQGFSPEGVFDADDIEQALQAMERQQLSTLTKPSSIPDNQTEQEVSKYSDRFTDTSNEQSLNLKQRRQNLDDFFSNVGKTIGKSTCCSWRCRWTSSYGYR